LEFRKTFTAIAKKVPEITDSLSKLLEKPEFRDHLSKAGTIGNLCVIGLEIYDTVKNSLQTPEKKAFGAILRIVFESTKEALPKSDEINLKDIKREDIISELFDIFQEEDRDWKLDLPSHHVIDRYKEQIKHIVQNDPNHQDIDLEKFFIDFRIILENKAIIDEQIKVLSEENIKRVYEPALIRQYADNLRRYLKHVASFNDEVNPID
jgi:hypothetical protein